MKYRMENARDVTWSNPHALLVTAKDGGVIDELSSYSNFLGKLEYVRGLRNIFDFFGEISDDHEFNKHFREIYNKVLEGDLEGYEFDFAFGSLHYHMTLSKLGENMGITFNDQTRAVHERNAAQESAERGYDVIHALKNALAGMKLSSAAKRHIKRGNYEWAQRLLESQDNARDAALCNAETILNIERAEAGGPFVWGSCLFRTNIVEPVITLLQPKFRTKGATYKRHFSPDQEDVEIYCDKGRVQSVFFHLIHNALSHGEEGLVISTGHEPFEDEGSVVGSRLICWNTKSFIPPEDRERVFDKFYGEGTGLGLHRVRNTIVNEHKGRISLESGIDDSIGETYTKVIADLYSEDFLRSNGLIQD